MTHQLQMSNYPSTKILRCRLHFLGNISSTLLVMTEMVLKVPWAKIIWKEMSPQLVNMGISALAANPKVIHHTD